MAYGLFREEAGSFGLQFFGGHRDYFAVAPDVHRQTHAGALNNDSLDGSFQRHFRLLFPG